MNQVDQMDQIDQIDQKNQTDQITGARSMRHAVRITFAILVITLIIPGLALAGSATLHWQANTEPDLAGYRIYYGTSSRSYGAPISVDKNTTSYTLNNLTDGKTYYFALTAVDTSGNESGYSEEVMKHLKDPTPSPPPPPPPSPSPAPSPSPSPGPAEPVAPEGGLASESPTAKLPLVPDIKANGHDGLVIIRPDTKIEIAVSLDKGDYADQECEWWITAETSYGVYSYVYKVGWVKGERLCGSSKAFDVSHYPIFSGNLPLGTYTFTFALDDNIDGVKEETWSDTIKIIVTK